MLRAPSTIRPPYDKNWPPDYRAVYEWRETRLEFLLEDPDRIRAMHAYYKQSCIKFINHWCTTYDPRNAASGKPTTMPLVMFEKQEDFVQCILDCLIEQQNGLVEKARDMGATWLACAISIWLWRYWDGASVGWGSRERDLVDRLGDPDSIFEKMRVLIRHLPSIFYPPGFKEKDHMSFMRIINPESGSSITGDIGDNIGRGGRKLIYFKDESAHYVHPEAIEAALMENTRCQIDLSSVHGLGNVFHRTRESGIDWQRGVELPKGKTRVLVLDWSDHPEKTQEWYDLKRQDSVNRGLLHKFKQEVERDYAGSVEGVIIKSEWVRAAIDAHIHLNFDDSGAWVAALDVADEGMDTNALAGRKGVVLRFIDEWGEGDTGFTTRRSIKTLKPYVPLLFQYDSNGVGAGVKAETNRLAEENLLPKGIRVVPWDAGAAPLKPEGRVVEGDRQSPLNKDFFHNIKAQGWWKLARRFENTWRARYDPEYKNWDPEDLISICSEIPLLRKLEKELCQPTFTQSARLKMLVDKMPDGTKSPNIGDAVMKAYWPVTSGPMVITPETLARSRRPTPGFIPRRPSRDVPRGGGGGRRFGYAQ